jgi:hypothetical protein
VWRDYTAATVRLRVAERPAMHSGA